MLTGEGKARHWLMLWVLPLVWMSIAANAPHAHDLKELAPRAAQNALSAGVSQVAPLALDEHECLLCAWASVATAWLQIAAAPGLSLAALALCLFAFHRVLFPTTHLCNSRAPPVCLLFSR